MENEQNPPPPDDDGSDASGLIAEAEAIAQHAQARVGQRRWQRALERMRASPDPEARASALFALRLEWQAILVANALEAGVLSPLASARLSDSLRAATLLDAHRAGALPKQAVKDGLLPGLLTWQRDFDTHAAYLRAALGLPPLDPAYLRQRDAFLRAHGRGPDRDDRDDSDRDWE